MSRKITISVALISLAVFALACISVLDEDIPSHFLNGSLFKIKNPISPFSKIKPEKTIQIALGRPDFSKLDRIEEIVRLQATRGLASLHCRLLSGRAPPVLS